MNKNKWGDEEERRRNLFMRLIEINDDLWHQIRLELEI